jgi:F-type H+-transporting ATPase subunit epsilon
MVDTPPRELHCVVVTPEKAVLDAVVDSVVLPMFDGELGVLPGRAALIGRLGPGELRTRRGNDLQRYFVDGGFAQVRDNVVTVLTPQAIKAEQVNRAEATAALAAPPVPKTDPEVRRKAQERARAQLRVAAHASTPAAPAT